VHCASLTNCGLGNLLRANLGWGTNGCGLRADADFGLRTVRIPQFAGQCPNPQLVRS